MLMTSQYFASKLLKTYAIVWLLTVIANCNVLTAAEQVPRIFDWNTYGRVISGNLLAELTVPGVTAMPDPGFHLTFTRTKEVIDYQAANGGIVGLLMVNAIAPYDGAAGTSTDFPGKNALANTLAYIDSKPDITLNYVLADFEDVPSQNHYAYRNCGEMLKLIRSHPNPRINKAYVGNYDYTPATSSFWHPQARDSHTVMNIYYNSVGTNNSPNPVGMNVAMPSIYPYSVYENHVLLNYPPGNCVSFPHATFWAPLERFSATARVIKPDHLYIPWVGGFIYNNGYTRCAPSSKVECRALLQHVRLRGADGYYTYDKTDSNEYTSNQDYRDDMYANAWKPLDWFFKLPGKRQILNKDTNKTGGVEWSGVRRGNRCLFIFSNYKSTPVTVTLPTSIENLPELSPEIPAAAGNDGRHVIMDYVVGPLAYWKMDESNGNSIADCMEGGHAGTISATCSKVSGKSGKALNFDAASSAVIPANARLNNLKDEITVEGWFYPTAYSDVDTYPVSKATSNSDANFKMCFFGRNSGANSNKITFYANAGGIWKAVSPAYSVTALNTWHHIVWSYSSIDGGKLFVNGVSQGSAVGSGVLAVNSADIVFGGGYAGKMDEVKIYSGVLSDQEVNDAYSCVLNARFDEGQGLSVQDDSIYANNGVVSGATWVKGRFGNALNFNAGSDSVRIADKQSLRLPDGVKVDLWLYPTAYDSGFASYPVSKASSDSDANFKLCFFGASAGADSNKIVFYANAGGAWKAVSPAYPVSALNTWHHIVWTYSSTDGGRLFVNDVQQGEAVAGAGLLAINSADMVIGGGFQGIIDEVKVYGIPETTEMYIPPTPGKMPATNSGADLIVNKVWWTAKPIAGQSLTVNYQISNIGSIRTNAGAERQVAKVYVNNVLADAVEYDDINPKRTITLSSVIPGSSINSRIQTRILVYADARNKIAEIRETNNTSSSSFKIDDRPDLTVRDIWLSPRPTARRTLTIFFKLNNIGLADAPAQTATIYIDGRAAGTVDCGSVAKGASVTKQLSLPGGISAGGSHRIKIVTDSDAVVEESNEGNNSLEKSLVIAR